MSDIIKLLPDSVANQIAAGEVIQRPASVIKELVENAVDAGATDIKIIIKDAGRTLIQVIDNGKGMSETDARMAFERHATSKIVKASDLFSLSTMGFRGEALPSICAISQVELRTKKNDSPLGTRLILNASKVETQEPFICEDGTNILVKNLFFNVPARRKFLKSDSVETSKIMREFEKLALVNNSIRMSIDTGGRYLDLKPASFKQRISDIWKNSLDLHLLPIDVDTAIVKINGYISRPEYARRRNPLQYLMVNGRNMRHPSFHNAIIKCFEGLIATDTQPCYFFKFEVDPSSIDINIHPSKNEINFENEQEIWPIIQASVKAALGKFGAVPSIDFNNDPLPVDTLPTGLSPKKPSLDIPSDYNPFKGSERPYTRPLFHSSETKGPKNWESLYDNFMRKNESETFTSTDRVNPDDNPNPELDFKQNLGAICLQHEDSYIITSKREGLVIIDQRRAHIKILFEKYLESIGNENHISQRVMFPESVVIDPSLQDILQELTPELIHLGFNLEYEEGNKWFITSVPASLKNVNVSDMILKILENLNEENHDYGKDKEMKTAMLEKMALVMARSTAIERHRRLSEDEMEHIVVSLFSLSDPSFTPDGKKIFHLLNDLNLENMFR